MESENRAHGARAQANEDEVRVRTSGSRGTHEVSPERNHPALPVRVQPSLQKELTRSSIQLASRVSELTGEVKKLKELEFMQVFKHPFKFLWFSFLKGIMIGFGSVLGASLLVGLFIYLLTQIKLVPYIGDFVEKIIGEIQIQKSLSPQPGPSISPQTNNP